MPRITIPNDDYLEAILAPDEPISTDENERIRIFLDIPNWVCPKCRLTNFGRNKYCADLKCRYAPTTNI